MFAAASAAITAANHDREVAAAENLPVVFDYEDLELQVRQAPNGSFLLVAMDEGEVIGILERRILKADDDARAYFDNLLGA